MAAKVRTAAKNPRTCSEQLDAGHIVNSTSPWNTPIFTIPKKSRKWRLLHDLRAVNAVMHDIGALQLGLPSPVMLPQNWELLMIDLKDCFFTIPLHPKDAERFAFTVPSIDKAEPAKRYHWIVLPQGMKNSPTMYQMFVAWALEPVRKMFNTLMIYHYMDDILIAGKNLNKEKVLQGITNILESGGLKLAPEKIQYRPPWQYLGWIIKDSTIKPQKLSLKTVLRTLTDAQKLVGAIQCVRSICGITNDDLKPLIKLVGTPTQANEFCQLNNEQKSSLEKISQKIVHSHAHRLVYGQPIILMIINSTKKRSYPFALIMQWIEQRCNPLIILEWIFLSIQPKKTVLTKPETFSQLIIKGRTRIIEMSGQEPNVIFVPVVQEYLEWMIHVSQEVQIAIAGFYGSITNKYPSHKMITIWQDQKFEEISSNSETPVEGITIFTDEGKRSKQAAVMWQESGVWTDHVLQGENNDSLQTLELSAVIWAFQNWPSVSINIVSDSLYAVGIVKRLKKSMLREVTNKRLYTLLLTLLQLLNSRKQPYFITHIRSHQNIGGLAEGNSRADQLVASAWTGPPVSSFEQARLSHEFFHQGAKMLR